MSVSATNGKAIRVTPEELIFDSVCINQPYTQQLVLRNNLSAPVELTLKASNQERIEIDPKFKKQLPNKTQKQKETIFIKSDFFDQKVNVTLIPSMQLSNITPRETSIGSSIRVSNNQPYHYKNISKNESKHLKRESSLIIEGGISGKQDFMSKEYSPNRMGQTQTFDQDRELENKNLQINDLKILVQQQKNEIQNVYAQLKGEVAKRKEIEENSQSNVYQDYLDQVRQALKEREPNLEKLMDITLRKEKEQQERKDAKILEILKVKDKQIEELQQRTVQQETQFGHLSQQYQDLKRQNILLEEENQNIIEKIRYYQNQHENALKQIQSYENGLDYQKIQEINNQLLQANQTIMNMQDQIDTLEQNNHEKDQAQRILQEAIERMREQILNKTSQIQDLENKIQDEIQRKISSEEHVQSLMQQINLMSQENLNERNIQMKQIKSDKDYIVRIDKLQSEKYDLISENDNYRRETLKAQEKGRQVIERLCQVRGFGGTFGTTNQSQNLVSLFEQIDRKVEDIARVLKEMEDDNIDITQKLKKANEKILTQGEELITLNNENQFMSSKIKIKKKSFGAQTQIDLHEMNNIWDNLNGLQQRCFELETAKEKNEQELIAYKQQLSFTQSELQKANQELNVIVKSHHHPQQLRNSISTSQSDFNQQHQFGSVHGQSQENEEMISKLNAKISSMKVNEVKLVEQINILKQNIKTSTILQQSEGGFTQSTKSTTGPSETERMRQYAQQLELNNQNLKQNFEEVQIERDQLQHDCKLLKDQIALLDRQLGRQQYSQGVNNNYGSNEIEAIREDYNYEVTNSKNNKVFTGQRIEELIKTNERLRKEHQKSILIVMDLKEEFANKIQTIGDSYEQDIEKLKNQNQQSLRKIESLQSQMHYMEKKEIRLFGQLEEARILQQQETEEKERRTKELEEILFKKEETLNDLEREIKQKERSLQERQEQISVLIEALENENSQDQLRQKVMNLSAELCSLKAIEAQQEKKSNEMVHLLKKTEMNYTRNIEQFNKKKAKNKELNNEIKRLEKESQLNIKKIQDLQMDLEDKVRHCNDNKYKLDREQFQLQLKEESIVQMRDQLRRQEMTFREEVEKLRKDFNEKSMQQAIQSQPNISKASLFKPQLSKLNLLLSELLQDNQYKQNEQVLIQELEKVINISSQTIEQIQQELDIQKIVNFKLQNEYKAVSLNKILIARQEAIINQMKSLHYLFDKRESDRESYIKEKDQLQNKLIKEQEQKINFIEKQIDEFEEQNNECQTKYKEEKEKKEDLESQLICFQQEINNQKLAFEKKAEITVDERFKVRYESIKSYFDSNITKLLLNHGNIDKVLELGREICSLKIVIEKQEQKLLSFQQDKDALEVNLYYFKECLSQQEQKEREIKIKYEQSLQKIKQQDLKSKKEFEKKKNEILQQDKDLLKLKEQLEEKTRQILRLEQQQISKQELDNLSQPVNFQEEQQNSIKIQEQNQLISQLQEKLLEIRSQHIQELEELKIQYDLEISEARKQIFKERQTLERRYMPGNAPGDILEQNELQKQKIDEFKMIIEQVTQENIILRKKIEQEKYNSESQKGYLQAHKQALADLETTLMEISSSQHQMFQNQMSQIQGNTQFQNFQKQQPEEKKRRSNKGVSKNPKNLHFKKDQQSSDYENKDIIQQSHSKINYADSSLDVSVFTSQLQNPQRQSQGGNYSSVTGTRQFMLNPPQLVKALVQSKINEMLFKKRVEELTQNEQMLREQYKKQINDQYYSKEDTESDFQLQEYKKKLLELELENEDLKIQRAQQHVELGKSLIEQKSSFVLEKQNENCSQTDYNVLISTVLALSYQLAQQENQNQQQNEPQQSIEQAQRLVIKSLTNNMLASSDKQGIDLQYQPSNEYDRKVWYLELLEQQLDISENVVKNLQNFIKKLSIDIQGNLQSAAQIKAASMDLALNTKQTAEEIQSVRYIAGLIKQDLVNIKGSNVINRDISNQTIMVQQQQQQQQMIQKTINPFTDNINYNEQLYSNIEQLQNQLTITDKVKSTLEKDLVALRISQSQELQHLQEQYRIASQQRDQLIATNEELHQKLINMDQKMQVMKEEISLISKEREHNLTNLLDKEREKDQLVKNKTATGKHLQKLQQDLNEWKKQADENSKTKDKQLQEVNAQLSNLTVERDRLKAENGMLRSNAKEMKKGENEEIKRLESEIQELQEQLDNEVENRKREIEFWVAERATMREMIDQLENDKVNIEQYVEAEKEGEVKTEEELKKIKKKNYKKLKQKEVEIKSKDKEVLDLKDQLQKVRLSATNLEKKIREVTMNYTEAEERVKYFSQKLKEVELEKELVLAEKNNAICSNDLTAQQISEELNSLRECFAKLKIERDNLLYEMETTRQKEKEWRLNVESLQQELQTMEKHLINREKEQGTQVKVMDSKCQAMVQDIRYLRTENERLKSRVKEQENSVFDQERCTHQQEMRCQELKFQIEENMRKINDSEREIKQRDEQVKNIQQLLVENERARFKEIEMLRNKLDQVKEANAQIVSLYENQLEVLKGKFMKEKGKSEHKTEQIFSLAQREAVIKNLKKENQTQKSKISKLQEKNKELKSQIKNNQENSLINTKVNTSKVIVLKKKQVNTSEVQKQQPLQPQINEDNYLQVMEQFQNQNSLMARITELENEYEKNQQWNIVLSQQLQQQQDANYQLQGEIEELQKKEVKESKLYKQSQNQSEISKQQKQEIKQLNQELQNLKQEWMSPDEKQQLLEQIKDLQGQIKQLKEEVARKREVISTMKLQREETEVEAKQIIQDMEGLKDDNIKLQKFAKEGNKNLQMIKDLKGSNDYYKVQEKKLKEELSQLNERNKIMKTDIARKEQIIRDYRDKLDSVQEDYSQAKDRFAEIERLKEQVKKYKLDIEIKEGQIKAMKQRIESKEDELEQVKLDNSSHIQNSQLTQQQMDSQLKQSKIKVKKYEGYLRKSLDTIKKIGRELAQTNEKLQKEQNRRNPYSKEKQNAMQMSELDRELYKESVNILGVSIDELEEFMNPSVSSVPRKMNQSKSENSALLAKLENALAIPESLNQDLEQICNQCVKLINDMNPDMQYL